MLILKGHVHVYQARKHIWGTPEKPVFGVNVRENLSLGLTSWPRGYKTFLCRVQNLSCSIMLKCKQLLAFQHLLA